jgi:L-lysine 2,3-aminomutase
MRGTPLKVLTNPLQLTSRLPDLGAARTAEAELVARTFHFRVPEFYARKVLLGTPDDPLLDLVLPSAEELNDGDELWDATPSPYRASDSPFWIQKYEFQGLLRLTTACGGLCRFCYLKRKNADPAVMSVSDVDQVFDDLESRGNRLREIILSGGDPLRAPTDTLSQIGLRAQRLRSKLGTVWPHLTIHTREPVWDPARLLERQSIWDALRLVRPKTYMINILHAREATPEFQLACARLAEAGGPTARAAMLCQHPLFRGVNDSVEILEELYARLMQCSPPVLPYYLVHPFYNGTLPKHRLSIRESQAIYAELIRRPGCIVPRLVVPTPWGKCVIGPHERFEEVEGKVALTTKDGERVLFD